MSATADQLRNALARQKLGQWTASEAIYREVLAKEPNNPDAVHLLGMAMQYAGREDETLQLLQRAVSLDPKAPHFQNNLGNALARIGREKEAVFHFREAIRLRPKYSEAHYNLGLVLERIENLTEALTEFDAVVSLRPEHADAHQHRGDVLRKMRRLFEAENAYKRVIAIRPDYPAPFHALAAVYGDMGNQAKVIECHQRFAELMPQSAAAGSDLLHVLHYDPERTREHLFQAALAWAKTHAEPPSNEGFSRHENDRTPERKLRIGYLSPDFHDHPMGRLMMPILTNLDRDEFVSVCYSDSKVSDRITEDLRSRAGEWHETWTLAETDLAEKIRQDRIDILVDLAGHMGGNRLAVFARKPAPIQITHFNYPDTTGMAAMDYRISDPLAEPPGSTDTFSTEQLLRLPHSAWCYDPGFDIPAVSNLPALSRGYVTFCSLNKPLKHSQPTIALWAQILKAVPNSKLLLLGTDASPLNPALRGPFAVHGITEDQLLFAPRVQRCKYMALYNNADIALDPFPYNGGITSCDAFWMGVPIISLEGDTYHSRQGVMLLTNLGLADLIAKDADEYVEKALSLAADLPRLKVLRAELRQRMVQCDIADGAAFTRHLEEAYRTIWKTWCNNS